MLGGWTTVSQQWRKSQSACTRKCPQYATLSMPADKWLSSHQVQETKANPFPYWITASTPTRHRILLDTNKTSLCQLVQSQWGWGENTSITKDLHRLSLTAYTVIVHFCGAGFCENTFTPFTQLTDFLCAFSQLWPIPHSAFSVSCSQGHLPWQWSKISSFMLLWAEHSRSLLEVSWPERPSRCYGTFQTIKWEYIMSF